MNEDEFAEPDENDHPITGDASQDDVEEYPLPPKKWAFYSVAGAVSGGVMGALIGWRLWMSCPQIAAVYCVVTTFWGAAIMANWWNIHNRRLW